MALRQWFTVAVLLVAPGCRTGRPSDVALETAFDDGDLVCDRVRAVMTSKDEGFLAFELPAVAEIVNRTRGASGPVADCGAQLLAWLCGQLDARPVDLRPRLEARVAALAPFIGSGGRRREAALGALDRLLLDGQRPVTHMREDFTFLGPGSAQKVSLGMKFIVSGDALDRWAVAALLRGSGPQADSVGWRSPGDRLGDDYIDLLVRLYAQRYRAGLPPQEPHLFGRQPWQFREPPPLPEQLGCGEAPLDYLWPEVQRAHRMRPDDPRWERLTPEVRAQLDAAPASCTPRQATR